MDLETELRLLLGLFEDDAQALAYLLGVKKGLLISIDKSEAIGICDKLFSEIESNIRVQAE